MDKYFLGCYWKDREEDAEACTNRIVRCLNGLASCDPTLAEVLIVPRSRNAPYSIPVNFETIKPLVEKGRNREDVPPRNIIKKLGYSISFVSDQKSRKDRWKIRTMCGAYPNVPAIVNYCALSLPEDEGSSALLLQLTKMTCLIKVMIEAFDPDWAIVQGSKFHDFVREWSGIPPHSPQKSFLGWIAYFADDLGNVPKDLPVYSRTKLEKGTLLVLTEDPITHHRLDHVTTTQAVIASLKEAGFIPA